jgi:hypothetical protein
LRLQAEEAHPPDVRNGRPSAGYSKRLGGPSNSPPYRTRWMAPES